LSTTVFSRRTLTITDGQHRYSEAGWNVLLIQKSILRDAVNDTSLAFLKRLIILVVKDIERDEIDFLTKSLGCKSIADIEAFSEDTPTSWKRRTTMGQKSSRLQA